MKRLWTMLFLAGACGVSAQTRPVEGLEVDGELAGGKGRITLTAELGDPVAAEVAPVIATTLETSVRFDGEALHQEIRAELEVLAGRPEQIELAVRGSGEIREVSGEGLARWSVENVATDTGGGSRILKLTLTEGFADATLSLGLATIRQVSNLPNTVELLTLADGERRLTQGRIRLAASEGHAVEVASGSEGIETVRSDEAAGGDFESAVRISDADYRVVLNLSRSQRPIEFRDFLLSGERAEGGALAFELTGTVVVNSPGKTAALRLLAGDAALRDVPEVEGLRFIHRDGAYEVFGTAAGEYPIRVPFVAKVTEVDGWHRSEFEVMPAALRPVSLQWDADAQGSPRLGDMRMTRLEPGFFEGHLGPRESVVLRWQTPRNDTGKVSLLYAVEAQAEVKVGVGLVRQRHALSVNVLQGELSELVFALEGEGEVVRVESPKVKSWHVTDAAGDRKLQVELRSSASDLDLEVFSQTPLDALPAEASPLRLRPNDALRYGGFIGVTADGAVAVEALETEALAQISPETLAYRLPETGEPLLAFRFSSADYALRLRAQPRVPEISASLLLLYDVAPEVQTLDAEMELEIRRAPVRDLEVTGPAGFSLGDVRASRLADYVLLGEDDGGAPRVRLVFDRPIDGRHLLTFRWERNADLPEREPLPIVELPAAETVRGHLGLKAAEGLRLSVTELERINEQPVSLFPRQVADLQLALRLRGVGWSGVFEIERLPSTLQGELFHLASFGDDAVYSSTLANVFISGAPVQRFTLRVPPGYENLEVIGREVRSWQPGENGLVNVDLQRPVSGAYTLLVLHEQPLSADGDTVGIGETELVGLDAERGFLVAVSESPLEVATAAQSPTLLPLQAEEIPDEFRLLFDATVLVAFEYTQRPYELALEVASYERQPTVDQVVDFIEAQTQVSADGELLTTVTYNVKSKGHPHFRLGLPPEAELWAITVDGERVTPLEEGGWLLAPLPPRNALEEPLTVNVRLAQPGGTGRLLDARLPELMQPALLTKWSIRSDGQWRLLFEDGSVLPDRFAPLTGGYRVALLATGGVVLILLGLLGQRCCTSRTLLAAAASFAGWTLGGLAIVLAAALATSTIPGERELTFTKPVAEAGELLTVQLNHFSVDSDRLGFPAPALASVVTGLLLVAATIIPAVAQRLKGRPRWALQALGVALVLMPPLFVTDGGAAFVFAFCLLVAMLWLPPSDRLQKRAGSAAAAILLVFQLAPQAEARETQPALPAEGVVRSLQQEIRLTGSSYEAEATLRWKAEARDQLTLLSGEAILQRIEIPEGVSIHDAADGVSGVILEAAEAGEFAVTFTYRGRFPPVDGGRALRVPTPVALEHSATVFGEGKSWAIVSKDAVSAEPHASEGSKTAIRFRFPPQPDLVIRSQPHERDFREEETVIYVEVFDLWQPVAGLVEGSHEVRVRPSKGEVGELELRAPLGLTITELTAPNLQFWRFDPDRGVVRMRFQPAQREPFTIALRSQYAASALPYTVEVGPLRVQKAAGQVGLVGLATHSEVQLGETAGAGVLGVNLEDFPSEMLDALDHRGGKPVLRRAFRWAEPEASLGVEALPVQPDLRVSARTRLSLGEDRALLATRLEADIRRAGVFQLSFPLPEGYHAETVSGPALSHWNEVEGENGPRVVLHLRGKTLGQQRFEISLIGPGLAESASLEVPRLRVTGASRQTGTVVLAPELGYRLDPREREGASQLDPQAHGIREPGASLWRFLSRDSRLRFAVQTIDPWVEVRQLQAVRVESGLLETRLSALVTIENAGVRELFWELPSEAISAQFSGPQVRTAEPVPGSPNRWRLELEQKQVGTLRFTATWQRPTPDQPPSVEVREAFPTGVNQLASYLTLEAGGRLQVSVGAAGSNRLPEGLQAIDYAMIPADLRSPQGGQVSEAFRVQQRGAAFAVAVLRRDAAAMLPAQISAIELASLVASDGGVLTRVLVTLDPGGKSLLEVALPAGADFWFAFVNQQGIRPWREGDRVLLPLERDPVEPEASTVEFYYLQQLPLPRKGRLKGSLRAPQLDLPMENITWRMLLPREWEIDEWEGDLNLEERERGNLFSNWSLASYAEVNVKNNLRQIESAGAQYQLSNQVLQEGDQMRARSLLQNAANLSTADAALNEDARVQFENVLQQQALLGITNRRMSMVRDNGLAPEVEPRQDLMQLTDEQARRLLSANPVDEAAALQRVATRLVDHQQETMAKPQALRIVVPEAGWEVRFTRRLQTSGGAPLSLSFEGHRPAPPRSGQGWRIALALAATAVLVSVRAWLLHGSQKQP